METVSKYSLNPLATCFIPSSMKYQSITSNVFPILSYESSVNKLYGAKTELLQNFRNEQTVTEYFGVTGGVKQVLSNPVEKKTVQEEPFVTTEELKELLSNTVKEEVVTEKLSVTAEEVTELLSITVKEGVVTETSLTTKGEHPTADDIGKEIPEKLNGEKISKKCSKKKIGSEVTSFKKLAKRLPNQSFMGKISELLKDRTKTLSTLLPFTISSMLILEFCYWIGVKSITVDLTLSSNLFSVFKPSCNAITYPKKKTKIEAKKINNKAKSNECRCPPMFGWIVPLQFFGNPLKLADTCCKEYVHTSYVDESSRQPQKSDHITLDESDVNDKAITLDQCSSELKAVIKDLCDSLSSSYEQSDKVSSQTEVSKTRKRPVWKTETKHEVEMKRSGLDIIDDGFHPLLQEIESEDTDDTDIASIQKLIGEAFSLHKEDSPLEILPSQSVCNLPCSIWCNKVPPPAKDTYKRFLKKLDSESTENPSKTDVIRKVPKKPLYKRCFSADDTPKSSDHGKMPFLSASSFESRERLLLLRKDPIAFIKQSSTLSSKDSNRKSRFNFSVASEQVSTKDYSNDCDSDKWSLYDGSDSMWQPLPDCIPSNDNAHKHSHRRVRDMRRQKSVG